MAQHDYNIANQSGASFRQDLNNALSAIVTLNSGATTPTTTFAYQLWADTTAGLLKIRNAANNAWITLAELDGTLTMETGTAGSPGLYFRGDTNTGFFSGAADELAIATAGVQRLMIDSTGKVLVGPGSAGRAVGGAVVAQLGIETLGQAFSLVRNSADTSGAIIALGKSRATTAGGVTAVQDADILGELRFCGANGTDLTSIGAHIRALVTGEVGTAGDTTDMPTSLVFSTTPNGEATAAEQLRITDDRYLRMAASTGGIQFNGDTAAANALDDYEEGTWTPTIEGISTAGTGTYTTQVGRYTKIGNKVVAHLWLDWSAHTGSGNLRVAGLPFASANVSALSPAFSMYADRFAYTGSAIGLVDLNTTKAALYVINNGVASNLPMDTSAQIVATITYQTA